MSLTSICFSFPFFSHILVVCAFLLFAADGTFSMSYVGYTVNSTTKRKIPQYFAAAEMSVLRRYSDFIWLREQIVKEFPG